MLEITMLDVALADSNRIRKLNDIGALLFGRAWPRDTWTAALLI
jgi:hypothetical protein